MDIAEVELDRKETISIQTNQKVIDNQIDVFLPLEDCTLQHNDRNQQTSKFSGFKHWVKSKLTGFDDSNTHSISEKSWLHPDLFNGYQQNAECFSDNVWQPSKLKIRDDLSRSVFQNVELFVPNDSIISTLRNKHVKNSKVKYCLKLKISQRASARLKQTGHDEQAIPIEITGVYYYRFKTGPSIFRLSCCVPCLDTTNVQPSQVIEAVYALSHNQGKFFWSLPEHEDTNNYKEFTLTEFAEDILDHKLTNKQRNARLYTSTFIKVNDFDKNESIELVSQLAGHRTHDYSLNTDLCTNRISFPFENIMRCTEFEGNAFLIMSKSNKPCPTFLQNFRFDNYENAYLPLQLLRYQQFCTLMYLQTILIDASCSKQPVDFIKLIEASLQSRLEKNIPVISKVNLHNQYYQSLGHALHIEDMMNKLIGDTQEISQLLRVRLEESSEKSLLWLHILGSGVMAFLTTYTVLKEVLSSFGLLSHKSANAAADKMHCIFSSNSITLPCVSMDILPVLSGLFVGCSLIAILIFIKHRSKKICHLGEHLYKDQVVIHGAIH